MCPKEQNSVIASVISSLTSSCKEVPVTAIPGIIDCILASTGITPSSLFASLLDSCNDLAVTNQVSVKEDQKLDSCWCNHVAVMVGALCHLLKKLGSDPNAMKAFIWKGFVPLMKMIHASDREILNQIAESFFDAISITDTWGVLEATLVPFLLRSLGLSLAMHQNEELVIFEWNQCLGGQDLNDLIYDISLDKESTHSLSEFFPLESLCHILTLILDAALHSFQTAPKRELSLANSCSYCERLLNNLLWDLCNMSERLLLHSKGHRSCAIGYLLPVLLKAFSSGNLPEISVRGSHKLSRNLFFRKMWKCCRSLLVLGSLERKDAYTVLSLYLSFFSFGEGLKNDQLSAEEEDFDVRNEREFWDEIKRGLVDSERLVRKQSLQILRAVLQISGEIQCSSGSEKKSRERHSVPNHMTKRELWAEKEAKSLGVGKLHNLLDSKLNGQQQWRAFILLYEMLEEYGTHLVEAAWNHQVSLLLQFSVSKDNFSMYVGGQICQSNISTSSESFSWLTILWQLGFRHDNPQVRCLIMESFLAIEWMNYGDSIQSVPQSFVLGPFMEGLNDPIHHKDFGVKGVYTSGTIEGAAKFLLRYSSYLDLRKGIHFLHSLASAGKHQSFGRAGLMALAECIASAACGIATYSNKNVELIEDPLPKGDQPEESREIFAHNDRTELLDVFRFVIESSKQHFNPNYRLQVCEKILYAAGSVISTSDIPLETLLHFISSLPREFTDCGGLLREKTQKWLVACDKKQHSADCSAKIWLLKSLEDFTERFVCTQHMDSPFTFDDGDLNVWESKAKRWARVLFLVIEGHDQLEPILKFIHNYGIKVCKQHNHLEWLPVKFLVLLSSLVVEIQVMQEKATVVGFKNRSRTEVSLHETVDELVIIKEKCYDIFLFILEELVSFAKMSCSVFWSGIVKDMSLPSSVRGKLGGPSQRRLSSSITTDVLQAIVSMRAVASITSWCEQFKSDIRLSSSWTFLWKFFWETISYPVSNSETGAEIHLAAYEALSSVLRVVVSTPWPLALYLIGGNHDLSPPTSEVKPFLDVLVLNFLENINGLLTVAALARTRKAVLLNWKWLCLESMLSIPYYALKSRFQLENNSFFFSDTTIKHIFSDVVESLENAGEDSTLSILRSVRLAMSLFASGKSGSLVSSCNGVDVQMMWRLVRSSWILHLGSNKRRVACIAALLSSVLQTSVFVEEAMHSSAGATGPLKWFIENALEEGTKSPRTIRLAALHLTGLWLSHPTTIKYYMKELKLLTLYGSVAFDEDFEAELAENDGARTEVSLLAKVPESELTEVFINTELYARVSVAVLFQKLADLADLVGSANETKDCLFALESGKLFLLELLNSVVNEKDLAKELYKKYSGIHRRKVRAWQMICILSRFVTIDILGQVTESLHTSLYRNNLPGVRQYLEMFAINIYLKFPSLVGEQLIPILRDYNMRPQALSSYVFIAANVILHASVAVQLRYLEELLPPIIPLLTSHHHSLRGFTQLLVHQIFRKIFPLLKREDSDMGPLEKRCFEDLEAYLANNPDCRRLRVSMEGHLDAYDPIVSSTPAGIFVNRVEEIEFECVPMSIMEEVLNFLNDAREDLRSSMAKEVVTIRNESLKVEDLSSKKMVSNGHLREETSIDFQKKIDFSKHELQDTGSNFVFRNDNLYKQLLGIEQEDQLLDYSLRFRNLTMEKLRASRQQIILVASFLDRIPNLAGLARTCEVFKASGLVIADASILRDKQFQLISVTAEKWVPITEVPLNSVKQFLEQKKRQGFSILGLEQTANSKSLDQYAFPKKTVLVLGREKEGIPVDIIHILDTCIEIPQLGIVRSLNVHVSGAIALWEYTRQQRSQ